MATPSSCSSTSQSRTSLLLLSTLPPSDVYCCILTPCSCRSSITIMATNDNESTAYHPTLGDFVDEEGKLGFINQYNALIPRRILDHYRRSERLFHNHPRSNTTEGLAGPYHTGDGPEANERCVIDWVAYTKISNKNLSSSSFRCHSDTLGTRSREINHCAAGVHLQHRRMQRLSVRNPE